MATTRDYIEYLNGQVDIAPATSQEELQAAEAIQQLMAEHDLDVRLQEFDAPAWGGLPYRVLMIVLFIGVFLGGIQGTPVALGGVLVAVASFALFVARYMGSDLIGNVGPRARSQNVIGVHRATGPLADKANRPIVVVAHYDTPRDNVMYLPQMAGFVPIIGRVSPVLVAVAAGCALMQLLTFVPGVLRTVLWVAGIVAALPLLLTGVASVRERFAPCTDGANDNKSSVAALLGVMDAVRPGVDAARGLAGDAVDAARVVPRDAAEATPAPTAVVEELEEVVGVRHGKDTLDELRILPEGCEIVYVAPRVIRRAVADPIEVIGAAGAGEDAGADGDADAAGDGLLTATGDLAARGAQAARGAAERGRAIIGRLASRLGRGDDGDVALERGVNRDAAGAGAAGGAGAGGAAGAGSAAGSAGGAGAAAGSAGSADAVGAAAGGPAVDSGRDRIARGVTFSTEGDPSDSEAARRDDTGLATMGDLYDHGTPGSATPTPRPAAVDDRNWGTSDLAPEGGTNFARRAVLFDLPDPSTASSDPFASDAATRAAATAGDGEPDVSGDGTAPLNMPSAPAPVATSDNIAVLRPGDGWKGGATTRADLRSVDGAGDDETREDLRETVLAMGDDELVSHDVWFVALGSSARDHAGMRAFLGEYRKQIRGAFVINLSCVGAGTLTLLTREGIDNARRADRRLERLITSVADDLHLRLERGVLDWGTTDATPAMRARARSMTIMGMSDAGVPALSRTADDVAENIDPAACVAVTDLVCEVIRRS